MAKKVYFITISILVLAICFISHSYYKYKQIYSEKPSYFVFYNNGNPELYNLNTSHAKWTLEEQSKIISIKGSVTKTLKNSVVIKDNKGFQCFLEISNDKDLHIGDTVIGFFSGVDNTLIFPARFHHQYGYIKLG